MPKRVTASLERWSLELDGSPMHGGLSFVIPVRRGDERFVLKLVQSASESRSVALALQTWNGNGAVRLIDADPSQHALLLERLDETSTTSGLPMFAALNIAGTLLRQLAVPAPKQLPDLAREAEKFRATARSRWKMTGSVFPENWLQEAIAIAAQLGPRAQRLLVHYDLHDGNILRDRQQRWIAIDPKVVAGDLEFGVAQLLWRRLDEIHSAAALDKVLSYLCDVAGLESSKALHWTRFRCVDYWLWGVSAGLTEDPQRCERMLEWLAPLDLSAA
ncbi:MAG: aminoglycoside phosphotransferase family protein [Sphingomicrobium sp.]